MMGDDGNRLTNRGKSLCSQHGRVKPGFFDGKRRLVPDGCHELEVVGLQTRR